MGSGQSTTHIPDASIPLESKAKLEKSDENRKVKKDLSKVCRKKERRWKRCVSGWYGDRFLPGRALETERSEDNCDELFEAFRVCYMRALLAEREKKGLNVTDGSVLAEFVEEEGINDVKEN